MRLKVAAVAIALYGSFGLLAAPADAAPKKKARVVDTHGNTVYVSRDESGRKRTRVIIQKRSYLDPGTETSRRTRRPRLRATADPSRRFPLFFYS